MSALLAGVVTIVGLVLMCSMWRPVCPPPRMQLLPPPAWQAVR